MKRNFLFVSIAAVLAMQSAAFAQSIFTPGNLVVLRSTYQDAGAISLIQPGSALPYSSTSTTSTANATNDGTFPGVFNNATPDPDFGVTSPVFIDQLTTGGSLVSSFNVTAAAAAAGVNLTTSFTSKSEGSLNLSQDGTSLSFVGYNAPIGAIDVSNANTPGVTNFSNKDIATATYREVGVINAFGNVSTTLTNAYAGDNPRAAILANNGSVYLTGNTGSAVTSGSPTAASVTGVQILTPGATPGTPQNVGLYSITQNGYTQDKLAKDNNFRGETIFNNTVYVSKGSGSQGINSVYQVGTGGTLPTGGSNTISILPGLPTTLANASSGVMHPFGLWFANATTLYVADEGNQAIGDETNPSTSNPFAGLQKWTFNGTQWNLAYTLQLGLNLGIPYSTPSYGTTDVSTDGLRNITGTVNNNGTVTIYAATSTFSSAADPGTDPNKLVDITDTLADTTLSQASSEQFTTLETAATGDVIRGVAFAPTPEPGSAVLMGIGGLVFGAIRRRRNS